MDENDMTELLLEMLEYYDGTLDEVDQVGLEEVYG